MLKIIAGFLPWIIYFLIVGSAPKLHVLAILATIAVTLVLNFKELKKGFILAWGTVIFFTFLLIATFFISSNWLEIHANLLGNSALTVIAGMSLILKKPFTLQYAREQVASEFWQSPIFIRINEIITLVWTISFLIGVVLNWLQLQSIHLNAWLYQFFAYGPSIVAIFFTKHFPDWYKQYHIHQKINASCESLNHNPFLKGNFAPVSDELDVTNLKIEGVIPPDLVGIYMRNGPNPAFPPFSYTYPFDGDGMLHAIYIKNGKAQYKNRFVETTQLCVEKRFGKAIYGGVNLPFIRDSHLLKSNDPDFPVKMGRFIHIIRHADTYLALHESISAYEVTAELKTIGEWNPTYETEAIAVNAHTRLDPETGELFFISYHDKPIITYHIFDKYCKITHSGSIDVPFISMVHDFVLTKNYIAIFLCPCLIDFIGMKAGSSFGSWKPELGTHIALLSRHTYEVTWLETQAFFTYHFANAYESHDEIIVDHVRYPAFDEKIRANLYRTTIHPSTKSCQHKLLNSLDVEFPRINEQYNSCPYRYIYMPANTCNQQGNERFDALVKFDVQTNHVSLHHFGKDIEIGEAVFVPKEGSACGTNIKQKLHNYNPSSALRGEEEVHLEAHSVQEDEGYLMLFIYHKTENKSFFIILDAQDISAKPLATIHLPRRIPYGLHGTWMPGEWSI